MWAIPVVPNRLITVVAKSAETFRVAILSQPTEKIATATQLLSLPVAAAVDVVNAEEELVQFAYQRSQELQTLVKEKLPPLSS